MSQKKGITNENIDKINFRETKVEVVTMGSTSRTINPTYPKIIEDSGHNGGTYFEHINWIKRMSGQNSSAATAEEGFWSVVIGVAAEKSYKDGKKIMVKELLEEEGLKDLYK